MNKSSPGFTLVEMLVVISIIAVLIALLFPAVGGILEKGKVTQDLSNLRQIGLATQTFVNDNDGTYFLPSSPDNWMQILHPTTTTGTQYLPAYKIFQSPFDKRSPSESASAPISYGFNGNAHGSNPNDRLPADKVVNPSAFVLFAPAVASGASATFQGKADTAVNVIRATSTPGGSASGGTHNRRQRIDVCFADLHVENFPWNTFQSDAPDSGSANSVSSRWHPDPANP